ncbi:MAG: hypothetical protein ABI874_05670, partial [Chloroflexota bacterium]
LVISLPVYLLVALLLGCFAWWWWNQTVAATAITDGVREAALQSDGYTRANDILTAGLGNLAQPYRDNIRIWRFPQLRSVFGTVSGELTVPLVNLKLRVQSSSFQRFEQFYAGPPEEWE